MKISTTRRSESNKPITSVILIAVMLSVFLYEISLSGRALATFFDRWAFVPVQFVVNGSAESVTPFSALFIHGGTIHLVSNLVFLWFIGRQVEHRLGNLRFLLFFILSGLLASLIQLLAEPASPIAIVGPSGAVAAALGAWFVHIVGVEFRPNDPKYDSHFPQSHLPVILVIGFWFLIQFFNGVTQVGQTQMQTGGVAFFSHIGSFIAGTVLFGLFLNDRKAKLFEQSPNFPTH